MRRTATRNAGVRMTEGVAAMDGARRLGVRVALVHDSFTQWGGAERVAAVLHDMFPEAPMYTLAVDPSVLPPGMRGVEFRTSFAQGLPGMPALAAYRRHLPLLPAAARSMRPRGFDLVVSSSSSFAHAVDVPGPCHVAYIHNTMRFAWDYADYVSGMGWPGPVRALGAVGAHWLRGWDRRAGARPGVLVANSSTVARRIRDRWRRQAEVIPPPVDLEGMIPGPDGGRVGFCVVTRLLPYKRVDAAIAAANLGGEPLTVVGAGVDLPRLRAMAGPTVTFAGPLSEADKRAVVARSVALLVPGVEDFGIAPVEANAAGTPVVAVAAGGVLDSQRDGVTAVLVREGTPEALLAGMRRAQEVRWDRAAIQASAGRFAVPAFRHRFQNILDAVLGAARAERVG